jgi:hypothetical protein
MSARDLASAGQRDAGLRALGQLDHPTILNRH